MSYCAAVITVSDRAFAGVYEDKSGPAVAEMLKEAGYEVVYTKIIPDEFDQIAQELRHCSDELKVCLALTTGGTGFSPRDITPEATLSVIERETRGIPEAMRAFSMTITDKACLSREAAGIRGETLIVNLPGSRKASTENLSAVLKPIHHGIEILRGETANCGEEHHHHHHHE